MSDQLNNSLQTLAETIRQKNLEIETLLLESSGPKPDGGCNHTACQCPQYIRGAGDGYCGACGHAAYEHL